MIARCPPGPQLRPFIRHLWAVHGEQTRGGTEREWALPTGWMHVVIRLDDPLRIFSGPTDTAGQIIGHAVIGGPRATACLKGTSGSLRCVGAQLDVAAAAAVLGAPARAFTGRHVPLADVVGTDADRLRARLLEAKGAERMLDTFQAWLAQRLDGSTEHEGIQSSARRLARGEGVGEVVRESGFSHRHFIARFQDAVGLTPKTFSRLRRFDRAMERFRAEPGAPLAAVALSAGYSDQAHFTRDFRDLRAGYAAGVRRASASAPGASSRSVWARRLIRPLCQFSTDAAGLHHEARLRTSNSSSRRARRAAAHCPGSYSWTRRRSTMNQGFDKAPPTGWPRISASVYYEDPRRAIDFLVEAFGFDVQVKHEEGGMIVHSQLVLPGGLVMVGGLRSVKGSEDPWRKSPRQIAGGNTQALFIYVDDADAHCARSRAAGAKIVSEPTTVDYGKQWWSDRTYEAADPEGHRWHFAHRVR